MSESKDKNSFVFYESWFEGAKVLNAKHRLLYLEAIINFGLYGEETELKGTENALFLAIKPTIRFNRKQKANGRQGGANQGNSNARKTTQKQPKNNPNLSIFINDEDVDKDKDEDKEPTKVGEGENNHPPARGEFLETFGILRNVHLAAEQYRHLVEDYGKQATDDTIDDLSCKLADGTAASDSHFATLLSWLRYQRRNGTPVQTTSSTANSNEQVMRIAWEALSETEREEYLNMHGGLPWEINKQNGHE